MSAVSFCLCGYHWVLSEAFQKGALSIQQLKGPSAHRPCVFVCTCARPWMKRLWFEGGACYVSQNFINIIYESRFGAWSLRHHQLSFYQYSNMFVLFYRQHFYLQEGTERGHSDSTSQFFIRIKFLARFFFKSNLIVHIIFSQISAEFLLVQQRVLVP